MYSKLKEKFSKFRYKLIGKLIKKITPSLYEKLCILTYNTSLSFQDIIINDLPRPSISFMKDYFNDKKLTGVEVGVQKGLNSKSILSNLNIKSLFLVDLWNELKHYNIVLKNFKNNKKVILLKCSSIKGSKSIKDNSLDFIYIDANHKYNYVYDDLDYWYPKIKKEGVISGHDIFSHIEVLKAVKDWCSINKINFIIKAPDFYFIKP